MVFLGCDMASIHCLLSQIPDNLDFEPILIEAQKHYKNYPPDKLEKLVKKRVDREYVNFSLLFVLKKMFCVVRKVFSISFYLFLLSSLVARRHPNRKTQ